MSVCKDVRIFKDPGNDIQPFLIRSRIPKQTSDAKLKLIKEILSGSFKLVKISFFLALLVTLFSKAYSPSQNAGFLETTASYLIIEFITKLDQEILFVFRDPFFIFCFLAFLYFCMMMKHRRKIRRAIQHRKIQNKVRKLTIYTVDNYASGQDTRADKLFLENELDDPPLAKKSTYSPKRKAPPLPISY